MWDLSFREEWGHPLGQTWSSYADTQTMSSEPWTCSSLFCLCADGRGKILGPLKLDQTKLTEEANQQVSELLLPLYTVSSSTQ